ncbi:MAG: hypothetical protein ACI9BW_002553 [Gammaproteobacteria bacterium]|jgi:hypothetical protein
MQSPPIVMDRHGANDPFTKNGELTPGPVLAGFTQLLVSP